MSILISVISLVIAIIFGIISIWLGIEANKFGKKSMVNSKMFEKKNLELIKYYEEDKPKEKIKNLRKKVFKDIDVIFTPFLNKLSILKNDFKYKNLFCYSFSKSRNFGYVFFHHKDLQFLRDEYKNSLCHVIDTDEFEANILYVISLLLEIYSDENYYDFNKQKSIFLLKRKFENIFEEKREIRLSMIKEQKDYFKRYDVVLIENYIQIYFLMKELNLNDNENNEMINSLRHILLIENQRNKYNFQLKEYIKILQNRGKLNFSFFKTNTETLFEVIFKFYENLYEIKIDDDLFLEIVEFHLREKFFKFLKNTYPNDESVNENNENINELKRLKYLIKMKTWNNWELEKCFFILDIFSWKSWEKNEKKINSWSNVINFSLSQSFYNIYNPHLNFDEKIEILTI